MYENLKRFCMKKNAEKIVYILLGMLAYQYVYAEYLRSSVIIPCHSVHAVYLEELLCNLEKQTLQPDEVVISLSDFRHVPKNIMYRLKKSRWNFPVTIITSDAVLFAGQNRNLACRYAKGDIIICQDADDLPHPQRIEIITYFFEHYDPDLIMHRYISLKPHENAQYSTYDLTSLPWISPENFETEAKNAIVNGNIALKKQVVKKYKWSAVRRGQDVAFNRMLFKMISNRILIQVPLYLYRQHFSSNAAIDPDRIISVIERSYNLYYTEREGYPVTHIVHEAHT